MLVGLQRRAELNGRLGTVIRRQSDRLGVRLLDGTELAIKPQNLEMVAATPPVDPFVTDFPLSDSSADGGSEPRTPTPRT